MKAREDDGTRETAQPTTIGYAWHLPPPYLVKTEGFGSRDQSRVSVLEAACSRPVQARGACYTVTQRVLDIILSTVALLVCSPVILLIGVLVKWDSPGSVLFKQVRIGINRRRHANIGYLGVERRREDLFGRPFMLYKFRTMYSNARELFPTLYQYSYNDEELAQLPIKILVSDKQASKDPRITPLGRWLRRSSLDEVPNFLNVLKGDMHLVGPRPDITQNIRYYSDAHMRKLGVKPGLTGLAQIRGRGNLSFLQTNENDIEYVDNRSLVLDLRILFKTIAITCRAIGAY